jgi:hypothetical protein
VLPVQLLFKNIWVILVSDIDDNIIGFEIEKGLEMLLNNSQPPWKRIAHSI